MITEMDTSPAQGSQWVGAPSVGSTPQKPNTALWPTKLGGDRE